MIAGWHKEIYCACFWMNIENRSDIHVFLKETRGNLSKPKIFLIY
jgi:hypothetical protein